jgi:S1-C subfamily serine protease
MRGIFGLVSLLVVVAIMAVMFKTYSIPVAKRGKKVQDQVRQLSGRSEDNTPADRSIKPDAEPGGGPLKDMVVLEVTAGGAMDKYYGLQVGDKITAINGTDIRSLSNDDFEMAKAQLVQEGFEKRAPITVIRNGDTMQLPVPHHEPNLAQGETATDTQQQDPGNSQRKSIEDQLNRVKSAGQQENH